MNTAVCILCDTNDHCRLLYRDNVSAEDLNPAIFSARRLPDRIHGEIVRCTRCGLVYPRKLIDPSLLAHLYRDSTYTYGQQEKYIRAVYKRYLRRVLPVLRNQPRPWTYLDIGCGNGFMLQAARELGFEEVSGIEPSRHAIEQADDALRGRITEGMFSAMLAGINCFDALTCFQTLDHIPDQRSLVDDCFTALKPGGCVLFINHNIASLTARILGVHCPMIDIEHTFLHTKQTMRALFGRAGFRDIQTFSVRNDYPLHYWLHLLPAPHHLKNSMQRFLKTVHMADIVIPFYPGNLGLIARKPTAE